MTDGTKILLSRSGMAAWLGISTAALRKHGDAWVMEGDRFDARATTAAYCASLRATVEARGGEAQIFELSVERARLAKERADEMSIKNQALRNSLVSAVEAESVWAAFLDALRARFISVPDRVRAPAGLTDAQVLAVDREVRAALAEPGNQKRVDHGD